MKKFLKVLLIVILVLGVIGGTVYFFFINLRKDKDPIVLVNHTKSDSKIKFNEDLLIIDANLDAVGDHRFDLIITTHNNLDEIMDTLSVYVVADGGKIGNKDVISSLSSVESSRAKANNMIKEYKAKMNTPYFNDSLGCNDLYEQISDYLIQYSNLVNDIKTYSIGLGYDGESDIKFNMIDLYTRIVEDSFDNVKIEYNQLSIIENTANIDKINSYFDINLGYMNIPNLYSKRINDFHDSYNRCDKAALVEQFANKMNTVASIDENTKEEDKAIFYLKKILGV